MKDFWVSLGLTFWAEMGDKTQFLALAFATRYSLRDVLLGVFWATALVHLVSVALGSLIGGWLPPGYVEALSAVCFLGFAIWTLREADPNEQVEEKRGHPVFIVGLTLFIAEFGDKTMLTAAALATTHGWISVWIGTTFGMVFSDALAVWVGRSIGHKIPRQLVTRISAALFFLFTGWYAFKAINAFR